MVGPATAEAQAPSPAPTSAVLVPLVTVSATGEEQVTPDRAKVLLGVQTQALTAAQAAAANARLQRAVLDTLRGLGIAAEQISTTGYNVFPDQDFDPQTRRTRLKGYNVQNTVVVDVRRLEQVGPVLDAALGRGANTVGGLQFYSSQQEAARRRALARAVENARQDAAAMAAAAGGQLGELVEVSSEFGFRPRPVEEAVMMRSAARDAMPTPISEGTQTVMASVWARWRFVAGAR
jgi:uncharacterized protein YggE